MKKPKLPTPAPNVIKLLREVSMHLYEVRSGYAFPQRTQDLIEQIAPILEAWTDRESVSELRGLLALKGQRGRPRTYRQMCREYRIACEYCELLEADVSPSDAKDHISAKYDIDDDKRIERYHEDWRDFIESGQRFSDLFRDSDIK